MRKRMGFVFTVLLVLFCAGGVFGQLPTLTESSGIASQNISWSDTSVTGSAWLFTINATTPASVDIPYVRYEKSYPATPIPGNGIMANIRLMEADSAKITLSYALDGTRIANSGPPTWIYASSGFSNIHFAFPTVPAGNFNKLLIAISYPDRRSSPPIAAVRKMLIDNIRLVNGADTTTFDVVDQVVSLPAAPTLISPANGETGVVRNPTFQWGSVQGVSWYHLKLVRVSTGDTVLTQDNIFGTSFQASGLEANTVYRWIVYAVNSAGQGPASAAWTFTTATSTALPGKPSLFTPLNGAVNMPLSVTLGWNHVASADSYRVEIRQGGVPIDQRMIGTTGFVSQNLAYRTTYAWTVAAKNTAGFGPSSDEWSFTTMDSPTSVPAVPVLLAPAEGVTVRADSSFYNWEGSAGAASYRIQILDSLGVVVRDNTQSSPGYWATGLPNGRLFRWRVLASNNAGSSAYSAERTVRTEALPQPALTAPVIFKPVQGATSVARPVNVQWTRGSSDAFEIRAIRVLGDSIVVSLSGFTGTSVDIQNLAANTGYMVQVRGSSPAITDWSYVNFTTADSGTQPPPTGQVGKIILTSPSNGSTNVPRNPRLTWKKDAQASSYQVQVTQVFTGGAVANISVADTSVVIPNQEALTTYAWKVRGMNSADSGDYSDVWVFSTGTMFQEEPGAGDLLLAPTLLTPPDNANISSSTIFSWTTVLGAARYGWEIRKASDSSLVLNEELLMTSTAGSGFVAGTQYIWRVRGIKSDGTPGNFSEYRRFTASSTALDAPTLVFPANNAVGVSTNVALVWNAVAGAEGYTARVSRNSAFTDLVGEQNVSEAHATFSLSPNAVYYWNVKARKGTTESWSEIWNFTTSLITDVDEEESLPAVFALAQNYPNPFNPSTTIAFTVPKSGLVNIIVYNILGRKVRTLISESISAGTHSAVFDGKDDFGNPVASGIYIYRMRAGNFAETKKMIFVK